MARNVTSFNSYKAQAYNAMLPENLYAFDLFQRHLGTALVNLFPMASEPMLILDLQTVRFVLEAEQVPREEWSLMTQKFQALHRAKEAVRP